MTDERNDIAVEMPRANGADILESGLSALILDGREFLRARACKAPSVVRFQSSCKSSYTDSH